MLMLVLIYDYLLLIYLDIYFAMSLAEKRIKVAYIVDAQSQMGEIQSYSMRIPCKHLLLMY